jgi:hypothetical protein
MDLVLGLTTAERHQGYGNQTSEHSGNSTGGYYFPIEQRGQGRGKELGSKPVSHENYLNNDRWLQQCGHFKH